MVYALAVKVFAGGWDDFRMMAVGWPVIYFFKVCNLL